MSILSVTEGECRECYSCVRICPVKAVKMAVGQVEIIDNRCIYCGRCVSACSHGSVKLGDDLQVALDILGSGKKAVAILAPECPASFYPMSTAEIAFLIEQAGFYGQEDTVLGEELVAQQYLRYFSVERDHPVIRSTCPATTTWIEKYYPDLKDYLAPIVTPMVAQARLAKSIYGDDVAIVYATPCIAAKSEAKMRQHGEIDAVLTFEEFKRLIKARLVDSVDEVPADGVAKPEVRRRYSVAGGFPRPTIARYNMLDTALLLVRDVSDLSGLASAIRKGEIKAKVIDLLVCDGCVCGPGIDSSLSVHKRKQVIENAYTNRLVSASEQLTFDQLEPYLPRIDVYRSFTDRHVNLPMPSDEALKDILAEGEKFVPEDELNCGACGYRSCRDLAVAIYQGIADWNMCFPFQRKVYKRIIDQLQETAVTDGLTGLSNHKSFTTRLSVEFNRAQRYGSQLSLMVIDVDHFKQVNDTYGHVTGDAVLKAVACYIKNNIRKSDIAARYGGDEFTLILPETSLDKALKVGEKLRRKVEASPIILNPDIVIYVTLSVGVASYDPLMEEPVALMEKADEALYRAKQAGRNRTMAPVNVAVE